MTQTTTSPEIRICEQCDSIDDACVALYVKSFPDKEREPINKLKRLLAAGKLLYHRTLNKEGALVCFSFVSLRSNFALLAYIATDPAQRSGGYGSKHMKQLLKLLEEGYPKFIGLFLEIEATNPTKIVVDEEGRKIRERRFEFYKRAGAKKATRITYSAVELVGGEEMEAELLYFEFAGRFPTDTHEQDEAIAFVVAEIYRGLYCLSMDHAFVERTIDYLDMLNRVRTRQRVEAIGSECVAIANCDESSCSEVSVDTTTTVTPTGEATSNPPSTEPAVQTVSSETAPGTTIAIADVKVIQPTNNVPVTITTTIAPTEKTA